MKSQALVTPFVLPLARGAAVSPNSTANSTTLEAWRDGPRYPGASRSSLDSSGPPHVLPFSHISSILKKRDELNDTTVDTTAPVVSRLSPGELSSIVSDILFAQGQVAAVLPAVAVAPAGNSLLTGLVGGLAGLFPCVETLLGEVVSILLPSGPVVNTGQLVGVPIPVALPVPFAGGVAGGLASALTVPVSVASPALGLVNPTAIAAPASDLVASILAPVADGAPSANVTNLPLAAGQCGCTVTITALSSGSRPPLSP